MARHPPNFSLPTNKKRLIAGCPRLFSELSQRPRVYITCTAFLASLYILVFQACHLWPHSTCPLLDIPLVFHNHNLHPAPRSCCHSTNHCYELVIRYSFLWNFNFHLKHIRNLFYALRKWKNEAVKNVWGKRQWKSLFLFLIRLNFSRSVPDSE